MPDKNTEELEYVMKRYRSAVYGVALANTRSHADAEDVYQEVFLLYFTKDLVFENESARQAWLIRTCINLCRTLRRSVWRSRRDDRDVEQLPGKAPLSPAECEVWQAVKSLPERSRTAVYLYYFENMPVSEVAAALGISEGAVQMRLTRARRQLEDKLKGGGFFG